MVAGICHRVRPHWQSFDVVWITVTAACDSSNDGDLLYVLSLWKRNKYDYIEWISQELWYGYFMSFGKRSESLYNEQIGT